MIKYLGLLLQSAIGVDNISPDVPTYTLYLYSTALVKRCRQAVSLLRVLQVRNTSMEMNVKQVPMTRKRSSRSVLGEKSTVTE